jgi:UDP-N-acetylmuramate--alanine ligase
MKSSRHFKQNSHRFIVNRSHPLAAELSTNTADDFALKMRKNAGHYSEDISEPGFQQNGLSISFAIKQCSIYNEDCRKA